MKFFQGLPRCFSGYNVLEVLHRVREPYDIFANFSRKGMKMGTYPDFLEWIEERTQHAGLHPIVRSFGR